MFEKNPDPAKIPKTGWTFAPMIRIEPRAGEPLEGDPSAPAAIPKGFVLEEGGALRILSWRWVSLQSVGAFIFILLWNAFLATVFYFALSSKGGLPFVILLLMLVLVAFGAAAEYAALAYLLNRTTVTVDAQRITVRHAPLRWFGEKDIPGAGIERVFSEKYESDEARYIERFVRG